MTPRRIADAWILIAAFLLAWLLSLTSPFQRLDA
jgi:hypothetical protein